MFLSKLKNKIKIDTLKNFQFLISYFYFFFKIKIENFTLYQSYKKF